MAGKLFGTDGIRDRAGQGLLSSENVTRLGRITGHLLKTRPELFHTTGPLPSNLWTGAHSYPHGVLIARDTRLSGAALEHELTAGLHESGIEVASAGVLPTPALVTLTRSWRCRLGIVISASHNPAPDNGIKMISPQGFKIPDEAEDRIEELFLHEPSGPGAGGSPQPSVDVSERARHEVDGFIDSVFRGLFLNGFRVVLDCANGAASRLAPETFRRLGAELTVLHANPDGKNINDRCGATHPEVVAQEVVRRHADIGIAFDGDSDRAIVCDETGAIRDGDYILAASAQAMHSRNQLGGLVVVSTIMANYGLEKFLGSIGVELVRTPVGDKYVAAEMLERGARLGGEQSGHIIFMDATTTGDGLVTALKIMHLMRSTGQRLSQLCRILTKVPQVLINIRVAEKKLFEDVPEVKRAVDDAQKALEGRGRLVLRYSGTEPLARVMVEGEDESMVQSVANQVARAIRTAIGV